MSELENLIPNLRRYARCILGDASRADDAVEAALRQAIKQNSSAAKVADGRTAVFKALHVKALALAGGNPSPGNGLAHGNHAGAQANTGAMSLRDAFEQLSAEHRSVMGLVLLEGLSYESTAEIVGKPTNDIKTIVASVRDHLSSVAGAEPPAGNTARPSEKGIDA